jgi:hypothetical protein
MVVPGTELTVRLMKGSAIKLEYPAMVLFDDGEHLVVRAPWAGGASLDLGFVRLGPGDEWTEHYFRNRWYSVKEIRDARGQLKGWYCDAARPVRVEEGLLLSEDLDLDLWVSADGETMVKLDEEEFVRSGIAERDPEAAAEARRAIEELEHMALERFVAIAVDV